MVDRGVELPLDLVASEQAVGAKVGNRRLSDSRMQGDAIQEDLPMY
jgi:hypothetical protein